MEILTFIGVIVILIFVVNLHGRVKRLEQSSSQDMSKENYEPQSKQFESRQSAAFNSLRNYIEQRVRQGAGRKEIKDSLLASGWHTDDAEKAFDLVAPPAQSERPADAPMQAGQISFNKIIEWLKEDWLLKTGALLLIIGFGWLTTYAFLNNWIGPMGRIALGIAAGIAFILIGWWRIKKYINQGGIFLVLGSTTILLTIFAARAVYDFFTPLSALIVMFLSTAFVALASVKYNSRVLALLSLAMAGAVPLLTKTPATDHIGLFAYLFIIMLGAIWIVFLTGQRELTAAALIIISLYSAPHLFSPTLFPLADPSNLLLFAYAFTAIFFLTNTAGILKLKGKELIPDLVTAAGNGLFLLVWIMIAAQEEWKSLIISAWMIVFAAGAFLIFKITQRREPFYVYAGVGVAMLAAATYAELSGAMLVIAYSIEVGAISLIAYSVLRDIKTIERVNLLLIGPIILSVGSITSRAWTKGVIHEDFFALLVLGLIIFGLGLSFMRRVREVEDKESQQLNAAYLIIGSIYVYALLWLSLHAGLQNDNTAIMISLVIYTITGLVSYFYGLANAKKGLRLYGTALIGLVIGRLLLVDIWKMELAGRIITFFLIGALLVSTAFFGRKKRDSNSLNNAK